MSSRRKSFTIAYLLLFMGGGLGLHLLYLRRDRQAFVYWCTFGGYFGLGPIRDFFRLPAYLKDANYDEEYMHSLGSKMRTYNKPPFSFSRFLAQVMVGNSWSYLWMSAVPEDEIFGISFRVLLFFAPIAAALGVWLIGNIGREKGDLKIAVIGAYLSVPLALLHTSAFNWSSITSALVFHWNAKQWQRASPRNYSFCRRFVYLSCGWYIFCSVWVMYIYFNGEIIYNDGEKAKLKDAIPNFFKSPMFLEFKKNLWKLYDDLIEKGWSEAWNNLKELVDPLGEYHALKILSLPRNATQEEITSRFKKLSREWHPDRHKDPDSKKGAHNKFVEIAEAYEKLSNIKKRRKQKNKMNEDEYRETIQL